MSISNEMITTIAFEVGVIAVSTIASFLLPGLGGLLVSGAIQILGDLGLEFLAGGLPNDITWYLVEFLSVFGPFFQEFKNTKWLSSVLKPLEKATAKAERVLQKIDDALFEGIEFLKHKTEKQLANRASGLSQDLENEIKVIEKQEITREKLGDGVRVKKKIISFTPNTRDKNSWIAGVGFVEKARFGPRDIRGDLVVTYYTNNANRVGFARKPIEKIVLGRTSAGEVASGGKNNKSRYRTVSREIKHSGTRVRKVVFKNAKYYSDYLGFCKAKSWGGYYMRRWMVGVPGAKQGTNAFILFGSIWRVKSKLNSLYGDANDLLFNPKGYFSAKAKEYFGTTQFGSKYNKVTGVFSQMNSIKDNPFAEGKNKLRQKGEQARDIARNNSVKKKPKRRK